MSRLFLPFILIGSRTWIGLKSHPSRKTFHQLDKVRLNCAMDHGRAHVCWCYKVCSAQSIYDTWIIRKDLRQDSSNAAWLDHDLSGETKLPDYFSNTSGFAHKWSISNEKSREQKSPETFSYPWSWSRRWQTFLWVDAGSFSFLSCCFFHYTITW